MGQCREDWSLDQELRATGLGLAEGVGSILGKKNTDSGRLGGSVG